MKRRREYPDDDGHVIADMSGIERQRLWIPRLGGRQPGPARPEAGERQDWESSFTPEEQRLAVLGALKAALLIALAFIIGLGAVILLMVLVW